VKKIIAKESINNDERTNLQRKKIIGSKKPFYWNFI